MTGPQHYFVRAADLPRESEEVIAVWNSALHAGTSRAEKLDRFYRRCPWGRGNVFVLIHSPSQKIVGVAGYGVRRFQLRSKCAHAGLVADMSVLAEHRTFWPALLLQKALVASAGNSIDFLYGFPNAKAIQILRRTGYGVFGEVHRLTMVVRHAAYLQRRMPFPIARLVGAAADFVATLRRLQRAPSFKRLKLEALLPTDARIDALWEASRNRVECAAPRDSAHLAYRFLGDLIPPFQVLGVTGAGEELVAWFCYRKEGEILHVYDYWSLNCGLVSRRVALSLVTVAQRLKCSAVSVEVGGARNVVDSWRLSGYSDRETRTVLRFGQPGGLFEHLTASFITAADEDE